MISKNIAEVLIGGKIVKLSGYESAEYLQKIASYINGKINEFNELDGFKRQSLDYRNLLIELNIADDYFKAKKQADTLLKEYEGKDKEIYDLKHDLVASRLKYEETEKKNRNLKQEIDSLQKKLVRLETELASANGGRRCGRTEEITCEITGKRA